jgi:hypothetical protein
VSTLPPLTPVSILDKEKDAMAKDNDKTPTPNDQRSNVKNPTSPDHKAAQDNRSKQMNPQQPATPPHQPSKKG